MPYGLSRLEFGRVLGSPKFQSCVVALGRYTAKTCAEGGLAVYKNRTTGKLSISQPDLASAKEREERRVQENELRSIHDHLDTSRDKNSFSWAKLTHSRTGIMRRDIGMLIHSHPTEAPEKPTEFLRPSIRDLAYNEETRVHNPCVIEGILVVEGVTSQILFWRESSTQPLTYFYNQLDKAPPAVDLIAMMQDNGFNTAVAELDIKRGVLTTHPDNVSDQLFQ